MISYPLIHRSKKGGDAIAAGGFGCVFKPSLKCPGEKGGKDDVVSKVFFSEDTYTGRCNGTLWEKSN